jgi:hypothetical protein
MKFTKAQMQFIKSKFPEIDEVSFAQEAIDFVPKKKVMKEVPEDERCVALRKDGERCTKRHTKTGNKCTIHEKTFLHDNVDTTKKVLLVKSKCCATTQKGEPCKKNAIDNGMCSVHNATAAKAIVPEPSVIMVN